MLPLFALLSTSVHVISFLARVELTCLHPRRLFSASADKTVMAWDTVVGVRVKKLNEHTSFVNSCCPSKKGNLLVSGSDDKAVKVPFAIQNWPDSRPAAWSWTCAGFKALD